MKIISLAVLYVRAFVLFLDLGSDKGGRKTQLMRPHQLQADQIGFQPPTNHSTCNGQCTIRRYSHHDKILLKRANKQKNKP